VSGPALWGRHAVVTGAAGGIGAAIADELARLGADLTLMGRTQATLEARAEALGDRARAISVDVTDEGSVRRAFACARDALGPPTILVTAAGIGESAPFDRTDVAMWRRTLDVDLTGAYLCIQETLAGAVAEGWGRIVNIASTAGLRGAAYISAYAASKHAVIGLTKSLALEVAAKGITVNAVCPGYTDTEIVTRAVANIAAKTGRSKDEALETLLATNPQHRLITPEEVAHTVLWLCAPGTESVTGQSIVLAGGEVS
jgi:NAD(P)-dependent dehydrogenase (short-subunit alcohol dehydrogenase family)